MHRTEAEKHHHQWNQMNPQVREILPPIELLSHDVIPVDGAITPVRAVELCIDILIDES